MALHFAMKNEKIKSNFSKIWSNSDKSTEKLQHVNVSSLSVKDRTGRKRLKAKWISSLNLSRFQAAEMN